MPVALAPGDNVRIISPAGPVIAGALDRGIARLREWGYRVSLSPHAKGVSGYLSAPDDGRLDDLLGALLDPEVRGIICSRGGYGSMRLLSGIPWERIEVLEQKLFVGFSDIGAIQLNLWQRCGWITFSGPQVGMALGGGVTDKTAVHLHGMLDGSWRRLAWPDGDRVRLKPVRAPSKVGMMVSGTIVPCCLSVLVALIGTPFQPDLAGAVLLLEDLNEAPYRIDRLFWQLAQSGILSQLRGLVLGRFIYDGADIAETAAGIAVEAANSCGDFPIWRDMPYGHVSDRLTVPMGCRVSISAEGVISIDDAPTEDLT